MGNSFQKSKKIQVSLARLGAGFGSAPVGIIPNRISAHPACLSMRSNAPQGGAVALDGITGYDRHLQITSAISGDSASECDSPSFLIRISQKDKFLVQN